MTKLLGVMSLHGWGFGDTGDLSPYRRDLGGQGKYATSWPGSRRTYSMTSLLETCHPMTGVLGVMSLHG